MSGQTHDPELVSLETALSALRPAPGGIDRDELLFRAGQVSVRRRGWVWPATAVVLAAALTATLLYRPAPQPVERVVYIHVPVERSLPPVPAVSPQPEPPEIGPLAATTGKGPTQPDYLQLRDQVLRWGVDALPQAPNGSAWGPYEGPVQPPDVWNRRDFFHPRTARLLGGAS